MERSEAPVESARISLQCGIPKHTQSLVERQCNALTGENQLANEYCRKLMLEKIQPFEDACNQTLNFLQKMEDEPEVAAGTLAVLEQAMKRKRVMSTVASSKDAPVELRPPVSPQPGSIKLCQLQLHSEGSGETRNCDDVTWQKHFRFTASDNDMITEFRPANNACEFPEKMQMCLLDENGEDRQCFLLQSGNVLAETRDGKPCHILKIPNGEFRKVAPNGVRFYSGQ